MQVDGPGMAYLFFYDKQGHRGLKCDDAQALQAHMVQVSSESISHSAHFIALPLPLAEPSIQTTLCLT